MTSISCGTTHEKRNECFARVRVTSSLPFWFSHSLNHFPSPQKVSGQIPEEPVVSVKSGHVFERRLIEKYVTANNKCPVTGEPLTIADLLPLKGECFCFVCFFLLGNSNKKTTTSSGVNKATKPRVTGATSIPGMLQLFQSEWDAVMLEVFTLKQQLDTAKAELAQTLYRHDAACRVIARLVNERDEARKLLAESHLPHASVSSAPAAAASSAPAPAAMEVEEKKLPESVPDDVKAKVLEKHDLLSKARRNRTVSETLAKPEEVGSFGSPESVLVSSGAVCLDSRANIAAAGLEDGTACLVDLSERSVVATFVGHTKRTSAVALHPELRDVFVTASHDRTARVWSAKEKTAEPVVLTGHDAELSGVDVHPVGDFVVTSSADKSWALWDIRTGGQLLRKRDPQKSDCPLSCIRFHPDGVIVATGGVDAVLRMWDIRAPSGVVVVFSGHTGKITSASFSENG